MLISQLIKGSKEKIFIKPIRRFNKNLLLAAFYQLTYQHNLNTFQCFGIPRYTVNSASRCELYCFRAKNIKYSPSPITYLDYIYI